MELGGLSEYLQLLDTPEQSTVENLQAIMAAYPEWKPLVTVDDNGATAVHHTVGVTLPDEESSSDSTSQNVANILSLLAFFMSMVTGDNDKDEAVSLAALNAFLAKKDVDGETLLHYAARGGVTTIIKHLLAVIGSGSTTKAASSSESTLQRQLDAINTKAGNGATPFHFASEGGHTEALSTFMNVYYELKKLNEGSAKAVVAAAPNLKRDNGGMTAIHYACSKGHLATVRFLIEGENVTSEGPEKAEGDVSVPKDGCDAFIHDNDSTTALHYASLGGNLALIEYLIYTCGGEFAKPALIVDSLGQTPLLFAAMGGHQKVLETLVSKYKCDPKAQTSMATGGMTALHFAASNGDKEMMRYLRSCGCESSIVNADGLTADEILEEVLANQNEGCCRGSDCDEESHHH